MKLFVSYSRSDGVDFAEQIQEHLSKFKYDVFIDVNSITGGDIWNNTIEENIVQCDIFVVILTHGASISKHVEKEVLQAKEQKRTIIPCFHKSAFTRLALLWGLDVIQGLQFDDKYDLARKLYLMVDNFEKPINKSQPDSKDITTTQDNNVANSYQLQIEKAKDLEDYGQYSKALKAYDQSIEINHKNFDAYYNKGLLQYKIGNFEKALDTLDKATEIDWKHKDVWYHLGKVLEKLGRYDEALNAFNTDLCIDNKEIKSWTDKANILVKLDRYKEALEAYEEILKLDPDNSEALKNKDITTKELKKQEFSSSIKEIASKFLDKDYSNVIELCDKTIKENDQNDPIILYSYLYKGNSLYESKQYEKARECYDKVLKIDPQNTEALNKRKKIQEQLDKLPVKVGEEYDVKIEAMSKRGDSGVAKIEGMIIFVANTKEGDQVKIKIKRIGRGYVIADVV